MVGLVLSACFVTGALDCAIDDVTRVTVEDTARVCGITPVVSLLLGPGLGGELLPGASFGVSCCC